MGSHSVTCHPTQVNAPRLNPSQSAGTRFTYPGQISYHSTINGHVTRFLPAVVHIVDRAVQVSVILGID